MALQDDDVVVDRMWLRRLGEAFAYDPSLGFVTGLVLPGEFAASGDVFEKLVQERANWSSKLTRDSFDIAQPPAGNPPFPFSGGGVVQRAPIWRCPAWCS